MKRFILLLLVLICMLAACATAQEVPMETNEPAPTMPERPIVNQEPSVGFAWEVRDGVAFLTGLGEVTQTDIVIPAQVSLVQTENGWTEAVESGAVYPVTVCGDAFRYCSELTTVTFNSGVVIEDNRMSRNNYGMFVMCKALTGVYNIPDTVTEMNATFAYCQSLTEIDRFPYCLTTLKSCFCNCSALVEIPELPETVTDMSGCFVECTSLTGLAKLPDALTDLEGCFRNCTALVEVPTVPDAVTSMANCFAGCVSLSGVPNLPASTTDMQGCFQGCTGLVQVPEFPSGVTDLSNCFQNCTSLVSVPTLPDSVVTMAKCFWKCSALERIDAFPTALKALDGCFVGCELLQSIPALPDTLMSMQQAFVQCTSLGGSVEIPQSIFKGKRNTAAFWGCCEIEEFVFGTCQFGADIGNYLKHEVKTTYRYDHITEGKCPHCGLTDQEIPAPPSLFVMENIPEYYENWFIDFIEKTVPAFLKEECVKYTFTNDITKYSSRGEDVGIAGLAGSSVIWIELQNSKAAMESAIYHELGHCYDLNTPVYDIQLGDKIEAMGFSYHALYSSSKEWKVLHQREGKTASRWYGDLYNTFTEEEKRGETFAISVEKYFTDPSALESRCPGMYAYVDALFRDLIAAEEAAKAAEVPAA